MGLAASRQLETHLHAVNTASRPALLFEDPNNLKVLTTIWQQVPDKYKSKFRRGRPKRVDRLPKIRSTASITLDPSIKEEYQLWKTDPSTILQHTATQIDYLPKHPVPNTYHRLIWLENLSVVNRILHRFLCIKLHRLKAAFQSKTLRGTTRHDFQSLILESGLTEDQKANVAGNLERWTRAGTRYLAIAAELDGTGALMLLPDDISPAVWEDLLPRTGPKFNEMMMHLKNRGICKEAKKMRANDVACGIERVMRDEWAVCQYRPGKSANSSSDRQPTNTPSTMLAETSSNGTRIAPKTGTELELSQPAVARGEEAQMTGWLGTRTVGQSVDRVAAISHDDSAPELGHFDAGIMDALQNSTEIDPGTLCFQGSGIDLANYLHYQQTDIDLANYLHYQQPHIDLANYLYSNPQNFDGTTLGRLDGAIVGGQLLGSPMPG